MRGKGEQEKVGSMEPPVNMEEAENSFVQGPPKPGINQVGACIWDQERPARTEVCSPPIGYVLHLRVQTHGRYLGQEKLISNRFGGYPPTRAEYKNL